MTLQEVCDRIQTALTEVMGPLAPVILKEKAAEFGMSMDSFSVEKMPELVEEASFEIQNHRRKVQFQRTALKILRELPQQPLVAPQSESPKGEPDEGSPFRRKTRLRLAEDPRTQRPESQRRGERRSATGAGAPARR